MIIVLNISYKIGTFTDVFSLPKSYNMKKLFSLLIIIFVTFELLIAQSDQLSVAEKSDYKSTSTYADVMKFINKLQADNPDFLKIETLTTSTEGNDVPLMILANPMPQSPEDIGDRIVVYLQANIHAGEVEGKEATQMLARDLLKNPDSDIMKKVIILMTPIFNIDGNEKISTNNRRNQVGPINGVGVRYNGQNLDLNRDAMKLETPEMKAVVSKILNVWDPSISVDCHTTNGSFHEEPVTFTWGQNPNGDRSVINYLRDKMMPDVHNNLWNTYDVDNIYYGVFIDRMDYSKGWISYASEPRYMVNYIGLRNRLAILNENYAYADYKNRVLGCYYFLQTVLEFAETNKDEIKQLINSADDKAISNTVKDSFAIDYQGKPVPEPITIKAFETDTIPGVKGYWRYKKSDRKVTVTVPYIADYYATENSSFPDAYLLVTVDPVVIGLLKTHGIVVEQLKDSITIEVEEFRFDKLSPAKRLNQGHYTNIVSGKFSTVDKHFPAGTYMVKTNQKLGRLAAALLEPEAKDCMLKWNFFDRYLAPQWGSGYYPYPVYKVISFEIK